MSPKIKRPLIITTLILLTILIIRFSSFTKTGFIAQYDSLYAVNEAQNNSPTLEEENFYIQLAKAAESRTQHLITYDPSYYPIPYPGGDIPSDKGVCSDVVIRSYRTLGLDLQKQVHEDMKKNFSEYPEIWGLTKPDPNIDHRRVPNLMTFLKKHGTTLTKSKNNKDYLPGDIVTWDLGRGITHIGIVSTIKNKTTGNYQIIHNIGAGPQIEDVLFNWTIIGHFRYKPANLQITKK